MRKKFERFVESKFALEIRQQGRIVFRSKKSGVTGLVAFIAKYGRQHQDLVIFDKVIGRAAALLFAYLKVKEVCGIVGSKSAARTLRQFKIAFHFQKTVAGILNKTKTGPCPMEKFSQSKTPEEFIKLLLKQS